MHGEYSLEDLNERLDQLVLQRDSKAKISEEKRRHIAKKFASKSLQELNEIACHLTTIE